MRRVTVTDRVGLGWRGELAASILERLDAIDVLEVIADEWTRVSKAQQRSLAALARECPLVLHSVTMGLASSETVEGKRLSALARLVEIVQPASWSEHLAFVRAGGIEIGHLAAPPRTESSIDGALANIERATRVVGSKPAMENIANLLDPPASIMDEPTWTRAILGDAGTPMLLDLHNLYANAVNSSGDPMMMLAAMPLDCVALVHLSGGRWLTPRDAEPRLLDDHLHDVPDPVYSMLETLAALVPQSLTVIIERDGNFPAIDALIAQLERARHALARGRAQRSAMLGDAA